MLTGVIASLLAQGVDAVQAAVAGVWLHGRAGDLLEAELTAYGRYAGGGCRASAAGHPGNFGITEGARCTLENVYQ